MSANLFTADSSKNEFLIIIGLKRQLSKIDNSSLNTSHSAHVKSNQINQKKNLYSAVYSTDSEVLGGRIKWGRRNDTDKFLSVFWK